MKDEKKGSDGSIVIPPPLNRTLPRVMVDGPFGSASEDFFKVRYQAIPRYIMRLMRGVLSV